MIDYYRKQAGNEEIPERDREDFAKAMWSQLAALTKQFPIVPREDT